MPAPVLGARTPLPSQSISHFQGVLGHIYPKITHPKSSLLGWDGALPAPGGATLLMRAWWPKMPSALSQGRRVDLSEPRAIMPQGDNGLTSVLIR
jgi:hypothetical protein